MAENLMRGIKPQHTGGFLVTFEDDVSKQEQMDILGASGSDNVESVSVNDSASKLDKFSQTERTAVAFSDINIGITDRNFLDEEDLALGVMSRKGREAYKSLGGNDRIKRVRPEYFMHTCWSFADQNTRTWGIDAVRAAESSYTGDGIKVAVLDTGFDIFHPDFQGRTIFSSSFVPGESAQDGNGHGTHCIGTAAGNISTQNVQTTRYGVAKNADIYVGKVLSNNGSGRESWIISGMMWAIQSGCEVISMSLGRNVSEGESYDPEYERIGKFALENDCLIIAAAGNASRRSGFVAPVGAPANSPSIMAVAAVDSKLKVARFSSGGINSDGQVDIAAPGVNVFSSYPAPRFYNELNGTSMACPHVAGLAALWAESNPSLRGIRLWNALTQSAREITGRSRDIGVGLVQVPH